MGDHSSWRVFSVSLKACNADGPIQIYVGFLLSMPLKLNGAYVWCYAESRELCSIGPRSHDSTVIARTWSPHMLAQELHCFPFRNHHISQLTSTANDFVLLAYCRFPRFSPGHRPSLQGGYPFPFKFTVLLSIVVLVTDYKKKNKKKKKISGNNNPTQ